MKIQNLSPKIRNILCVGLAGSLLLLNASGAYAQSVQRTTNGSNNATKVTPPASPPAAAAGGLSTAAVSASGTPGGAVVSALAAVSLGVGGGTGGTGGTSSAATTITNAATSAGASGATATGLSNVILNASPGSIGGAVGGQGDTSFNIPNNQLAVNSSQLGSLATGVLVASSQPLFLERQSLLLAQESVDENTRKAIVDLYNTFNTAYTASGLSAEDAKTNATNLLIALADMKNIFDRRGNLNIKTVNRLARLVQPSLLSAPKMADFVKNNRDSQSLKQIKDTVVSLKIVTDAVAIINNAL